MRKAARKAACACRGIARADHGDGVAVQQGKVAANHETGRAIFEMAEQFRIFRIVEEDITSACFFSRSQFLFHRPCIGDCRFAATALGEIGKRVQCSLCIAEAGDELAIADGADMG